MILTIKQYIETLTNAEGRFRTLGRLYPVTDGNGDPVFTMPGHGLADFDVVADGAAYTLRCPLKFDRNSAAGLRVLGEKEQRLDSRFFTGWRLLENEAVVFGEDGEPVEVDILARMTPQGEKAADFLQKKVAAHDTEAILAALKSFGELIEWASSNKCEGITGNKLLVGPDGQVRVTGFSANDASPEIALAFFFTACLPADFAKMGLPLVSGYSSARPTAQRLCAAVSVDFPELTQILAGDVAGGIRKLCGRTPDRITALGVKLSGEMPHVAEKDKESVSGYSWSPDDGEGVKCVRDGAGWRYVDRLNRPVIETVWLSASPFREGRAEVEAASGKGLIDRKGGAVLEPVYEELSWDEYWGLATAMTEGWWVLLDRDGELLTRERYDWLGECSEGLILAQKEGKCGYIDTEGREVIPFIYDDATSFSEGCAFVTSDGESFFIDGRGKTL